MQSWHGIFAKSDHDGLVVTRTLGSLRRYDEALLLRVHRIRAPHLTPLMFAFTRLGDTSSWVAFALLLLGAGAEGRRLAGLLALAAGGATLLLLGG